ncbi:MAG: EAL domain-containing protein [Rhizobacter sp.]|nr:EAL domain-containing protein [Rhizobacter sp.]
MSRLLRHGPLRTWRVWMRKSLGARIVLLFLGLLLVVQGLSFFAIRASIDHNARASIAADLEVGERLLRRLLEQNAHKLSEGATLLASDYGFRSAVASQDAATIGSVLANHGERIGAGVTALLDTGFKLRAAAPADPRDLEPVLARLAAHRGSPRPSGDVVMIGERPYQFVVVPLRAPVLMGWVLMGFPVDQRLLDEMHSLSSLQVSLEVRRDAAAPWTPVLSTLPRNARDTLARDGGLPRQALQHDGGVMALALPDGEYSARAVALTDDADPAAPAVSALLMLSVDEAVAPYRQLQLGLVVLTLLGVVVFGIGSVLTARRVTTPLRRLAAAAERLGAGDYATPLGGQHRTDEIGDLAHAFERMRVSVASQQEEILKLAYWDSLTGLPNRVQFRNAVMEAMALAKADHRSVAVLMLDLDRFKHVNDVLGYRFGDLLLKGVAERLSQQAVRNGDLVARLGGDEFAVLLADLEPASDLVQTTAVAQRLHQVFGDVMTLEDHTVDMNASFGIAVWPHHAADADGLLNRAEVAMYQAKRQGVGPLLYDPAFDAASHQTLSLLSELRHAVDHHELRLYLQPKLALDSGHVVGAEALVRWQHPTRGLVPPMQFIPFAEQTGFIRVLTLWVFEEAARMWRVLNEGGLRLVISVNLSTRDLLDLELPQKFEALLVKHMVPAEAFCLEITESAIMDDPQRAMGTLERLSGLGFRLSIDDFGTGYSSLAYLKRLPVDEIKIDKSFVMGMEKDVNDARIVRSTIDLAHGLGLTVVAEGVENAQVWNLLREQSCDEAQGFHMGRPMPSIEFAAWSSGWAARHSAARLAGAGERNVTLH